MKILFLVHVEDMFRDYFPDEAYVARLCRAMRHYDKVICLVSEVQDEAPIPEITAFGNWAYTQWTWGWGYEKDMDYDDDPNDYDEDGHSKWVIPTESPHEWTWVPPELRDADAWNQHQISVGGGSRWECLQDFIDVLEHVGIKHRIVDGYCYGN